MWAKELIKYVYILPLLVYCNPAAFNCFSNPVPLINNAISIPDLRVTTKNKWPLLVRVVETIYKKIRVGVIHLWRPQKWLIL